MKKRRTSKVLKETNKQRGEKRDGKKKEIFNFVSWQIHIQTPPSPKQITIFRTDKQTNKNIFPLAPSCD